MSHWYTIFASLGEDFDPTRQYTLNDFQFYNIYEHSSIIFEICHDAMQQEKLRGKVGSPKLCITLQIILKVLFYLVLG